MAWDLWQRRGLTAWTRQAVKTLKKPQRVRRSMRAHRLISEHSNLTAKFVRDDNLAACVRRDKICTRAK